MNNIYEPEFVRVLFNQMSGSYEQMNFITSFGFSIRWRRQCLNRLGKSEQNLQVIDLLSGLGENWNILNKNFPNASFTAIDFSEEMIRKSSTKAKKLFNNKLNLRCEDVLQSSLTSNHFDIISCAYGLKTFNEEQLTKFASEIHRILKPGGTFSFVEVSKPKNVLLHFLYQFYLANIIPLLGKIFLGNPSDYKMLWIYTEEFKNSKRAKSIFQNAGLQVKYENYFFGCASGLTGTK